METRSEVTNNPTSPRSVGREFVRQYYTILHEGPQYLHRFYSQNSSFIHGGVEKPGFEQQPVIGQTDIHKKVMSLDFQDCHAKIRQVDSQATVGNGVVVQVTGELSKNGMQMRRFMQTFVLAQQSPKNYYVYNDIFRYQDEVFSDTESEREDEAIDSDNDGVDMASQPDDALAHEMSYEPQASTIIIGNGTHHFCEVEKLDVQTKSLSNNDVPNMVKTGSDNELADEMEEVSEPETKEPIDTKQEVKSVNEVPDDIYGKVEDEQPEPSGTVSWAALASKSGPGGIVVSSQAPPPLVKPASKPMEKGDGPNPNAQPQRLARPPREQRMGAVRDRGTHSGSIGRNESEMDDSNKKPVGRYPDENQLFVGNLPQDTTDADLKEFFSVYGEVVDVRINNKNTGGKVPNFAFVVFEQVECVGKVLDSKLKRFGKDQRLLNVEMKKNNRPGLGPRSNFGSGPRGPPMDRNNFGRGGGNMGRSGGGGMRMSGSQNDRFGGRQEMGRGGMSGSTRGGINVRR